MSYLGTSTLVMSNNKEIEEPGLSTEEPAKAPELDEPKLGR